MNPSRSPAVPLSNRSAVSAFAQIAERLVSELLNVFPRLSRESRLSACHVYASNSTSLRRLSSVRFFAISHLLSPTVVISPSCLASISSSRYRRKTRRCPASNAPRRPQRPLQRPQAHREIRPQSLEHDEVEGTTERRLPRSGMRTACTSAAICYVQICRRFCSFRRRCVLLKGFFQTRALLVVGEFLNTLDDGFSLMLYCSLFPVSLCYWSELAGVKRGRDRGRPLTMQEVAPRQRRL